jgi:hypothetical protein
VFVLLAVPLLILAGVAWLLACLVATVSGAVGSPGARDRVDEPASADNPTARRCNRFGIIK